MLKNFTSKIPYSANLHDPAPLRYEDFAIRPVRPKIWLTNWQVFLICLFHQVLLQKAEAAPGNGSGLAACPRKGRGGAFMIRQNRFVVKL